MNAHAYPQPTDLWAMIELVTDRNVPRFKPNYSLIGTSKRNYEVVLNLGPGLKLIKNSFAFDLPNWDADKDCILPYADGEVDAIYAIHFLEHLKDPIAMLQECQRVLRPGGVLNIGLPYGRSQIAIQDLDHKTFWCEETWKTLFDNQYYRKNDRGWQFDIGLNLIVGLAERNLMLITQLIRR